MQYLLAATLRALQTIRPTGGAVASGGQLGNRELALIVGTGLLVAVSAAALFVRSITENDPSWPGASPIMRYLIAVGQALGAN
jgi:hypothetical protein